MAKLDKYSVLDIIKEYRNLIGNNFKKYIKFFLTQEDMKAFIERINAEISEFDLRTDFKTYQEFKSNLEYEIIESYLMMNKEINMDETIKLRVIGQIYKDFSEKLDKKSLEKIKYLILGKKQYAVFKFESEFDRGLTEYELITKDAEESIDNIKNDKIRKLFEYALLEIASIEDLEGIISREYGSDIFSVIMNKIAYEFFIKEKRMSSDEFRRIMEEGHFDEGYDLEFEESLKSYLKNNLQLLDKTSLLLNAAARMMLGIKLVKGEKIKGIVLGQTSADGKEDGQLKFSIDFLKELYQELIKNSYDDISYSIYDEEEGTEIITVNKNEIAEFLSRCIEDDYITDNDIENIHSQILEGVLVENLDARKIANINIQDLINLSNSYETKEDDEEKTKMLCCAVELAEYLKSEGLITNKKLLNLYFDGEINLDFIKNIDMTEITPEEYNQKFKMIYDRILYAFSEEEKQKEEQKLSRLAQLYKYLEKEEKIDIDGLIEKLLTAYGEEYGAEVMADLYELDIATFEKCIDWVGTPVLKELCKREKLPPAKVRELYENNIINLDMIAEIVNNSSNTTQKFMLIGSIFPEDQENRYYLLKYCISIASESEKKETTDLKEQKARKNQQYKKHMIDPFDRMQLISLIDSEYYFEMTTDGYAIVYLPNFKEIIIEKMLDKNNKPSYKAATYILSEEYFKRNRSRIIENGKVHRKEMIKDIEDEGVEKIRHFVESWGRKIKEHFGIQEGSRWSEEELTRIENAIEKTIKNQIVLGDNK